MLLQVSRREEQDSSSKRVEVASWKKKALGITHSTRDESGHELKASRPIIPRLGEQ